MENLFRSAQTNARSAVPLPDFAVMLVGADTRHRTLHDPLTIMPAMSETSRGNTCQGLLLLEPFYGGSHRQLIDLLHKSIPECALFTLPASKWHWRARTSALYFSCQIPNDHNFSVLFASSVLNLAELVALRPDLAGIRKVLYFHENQLVYPVQKQQDRDFQYGYNQILSCLVADAVVFNSSYNQESFLSSIESFLKLMPNRPRKLAERIRPKCQVLYFPIDFPPMLSNTGRSGPSDISSDKRQSQLRHPRHAPTPSSDFPDEGTRSPDGTLPSSQHPYHCHGSNSSDNLTHTGDGNRSVQSRMRRTPVGSRDKEEGNFGDEQETKFGRISLDNSQDNHMSSLPSVEASEVGTSSQNSKESEIVSVVPIANPEEKKEPDQNINCPSVPCSGTVAEHHHEDEVTLTVEEGAGQILNHDTLPSSSRVVEPNARCQMMERETSFPALPHDGGNGCHANLDHERVDKSFERDGKVPGSSTQPLHILWPHRWEHDKNPEQFFSTLFQLCDENCSFHLSVLGENYLQIPPIFKEAEFKLKDHIVNWGFVPSKECYYQILSEADVVVSTANHEFFGVAMLEATYFHCHPVCPERLVYPEIFPAEHLYRTPAQLLKKLRRFCRNPTLARCHKFQVDLTKYSWKTLEADYHKLLLKS